MKLTDKIYDQLHALDDLLTGIIKFLERANQKYNPGFFKTYEKINKFKMLRFWVRMLKETVEEVRRDEQDIAENKM